ncbi:rod shape-determining protein RodA [Parasutterella excrementihominis]|uniref:rod shape-determining protein RodA n=1 Tax=Parasutterella excrementihominis TaxID=487175 RepID=UPI003FEECD40
MNAHTREPFHIRILKGLLGIIWSIDWPLMVIVLILSAWGFVALYSAGYSFPWRIDGQIRNLAAAGAAMMLFATMPLKWTRNLAVPAYIVGLVLLVATLLFGVNTKGATRWLDIGVIRIQPSEIMKLATPLLIAWYFQIRLTAQEGVLKWWDYLVAFVMLALPVALILKQPDLGTSILVLASGFAVIFFAGLSWKFLLLLISGVLVALPIVWNSLYDYQRQRVLTLLDQSSDPLGAGFHTLQAIIAIGSGGMTGKGWMNGTQAHLDFIPERTSDFLFAVFSEEFGFFGDICLLGLYTLLIMRALYIASVANTVFERLLACAIATIFLIYSFVNMGMVSGILPVVGVPLPFMSYGGTALLILGICCGLLMKISAQRRIKVSLYGDDYRS